MEGRKERHWVQCWRERRWEEGREEKKVLKLRERLHKEEMKV